MNDREAVLTALETTPALLIPLIRETPEDLRKRRPAPGKWSAHEHFCHLVSQDPPMRERLQKMLAEDDPELVSYGPSPEDETGALLAVDLEEAIARFARERAELVAILRALPPEGWERTGRHPERDGYTVFVLARQMAVHDMLHGFRMEELRYHKDWPEGAQGPVPVEKGIPGSLARMKNGEVNLLGPFEVPGLPPRLVRVYLPNLYDRETPHYALYLFDGQNVFDDEPSFSGGWYAHEAAEGLVRARRPVPVVIGIDHGGESRISELSPFEFDGKPGQADLFLDWVTGTLMPALAAELNLIPGPAGAVIGGSSMGGLGSFYAHFRHPEAFGGALVMSPSFWLADEAIFDQVAGMPTPGISRLYLDGGTREDKGRLIPLLQRMVEHLVPRGYDSYRLMWRSDPKGAHSEASWRRRLPRALRFMYR
ncbi:MAG TPA: alpha/beta hydrolase-fold protein [Thermoanaerobaculia bacterium]|nr:alpha/beta hydrolase-fold protein [Thermoanaerobaculia bacterium]